VELALITALRERKKINGEIYKPFCLYDFVENQGVDIKFVEIASLEAVYSKDPGPIILLSSLRPHGRQYFSCAHEFGHHVFCHGMKLEKLKQNYSSQGFEPDEFLVDTFAGFLLMPKSTIQRAFNIRRINIHKFNPVNYYKVSSNIGVGYSTLVFHLFKSLRIINESLFHKLSSTPVKKIKQELLGQDFPGEVIYVDKYWEGRPIDIQIDNVLVVEGNCTFEGDLIEKIDFINGNTILKGLNTGIGKIQLNSCVKPFFLRVSRFQYKGFNKYKHLEV
jgi:Zn-dependent peptidase ImmA (M78 family)